MHKTALQSVRKGSKLLHFTHQIWKNNAQYEENVRKSTSKFSTLYIQVACPGASTSLQRRTKDTQC